MVAADPLSERSHAAVVRVLGELRRVRPALDHYEYARRVLESELAAPLSGELEQARQALHAPSAPRPERIPRAPSSLQRMLSGRRRPRQTRPLPWSVAVENASCSTGMWRQLVADRPGGLC